MTRWVGALAGIITLTYGLSTYAQKPPQAAVGTPGSAPVPSAGPAGLVFTRKDAESLVLPPPTKQLVVLCYALKYGGSSTQPFVLEPLEPGSERTRKAFTLSCKGAESDDVARSQCEVKAHWFWKKWDDTRTWNPCSVIDNDHPLLMRNELVIGIDPSEVTDRTRISAYSIAVTFQPGSAINSAPVRATFGAPAQASANAGALSPFFLAWPFELQGDVIPTVAVSAVYTPPTPADRWRPNTVYPEGAVVVPTFSNGHYYVATQSGVSTNQEPPLPMQNAAPTTKDGQLAWMDIGTSPPTGTSPQTGTPPAASPSPTPQPKILPWQPTHGYCQGDIILDVYNGHYYAETAASAAASGGGGCTANSDAAPSDPFPLTTSSSATVIVDGSIVWKA